ncbi:Chromosome partition protein Smc [Symmachiella dynata]|uniref:Chromosome partition protein Smc n=1 Tax=Symmachiella dynata TaxID=2527995 RepID=A0A517ZI50_9PLAN|nr:chromosome segregation protein SMC [Symmachiella dynata]QDU42156.1 Chromosome partition protein Smc [Symmachiella dynata]
MLKSLEMFGFKSFADRTRFDFAPGVTCVVGPNGSGKSNVVDSIKWILGDQSAKSLRGKEMTDVIFNGAAGRKPSGFAEATLSFDNSTRFLGIEADEVQVGRRLYRSGESEYLINKAPSRLKDVRDLLMGTGTGAYSIIEQGRVDQLLQASNVNRRAVFEEAAGISRFKARKVDAQRKLERVDQNLLRLKDIVQELGGRLNTMRQQAKKASRYRKYSSELRELRVGFAADEYRDLTARLGAISQSHDGWQSEIDELKAKSAEIEKQQAALDIRLTTVEDALQESQQRTAANREAIAGFQATSRHQSGRRDELSAELERLMSQQSNLTLRARDIAGELQQTLASLEDYEQNYEARNAALIAREEELSQFGQTLAERLQQLEAAREQTLEAKQRVAVLGGRMATNDARIKTIEAALAEDEKRISARQQELTAANSKLEVHHRELQKSQNRQAELRTRLTEERTRLEELSQARMDAEHAFNTHREQRTGWKARLQVLEDLESRNEGIGVGVREILTRARESHLAPWNQIRGSVADLLQVDLEHAALIEVALGSRSQLIVLEDADPLLEYLQGTACQISGRVGFLAVTEGTGQTAENGPLATVDLSDRPGVIARADQLVKSAATVPTLPAALLRDTWIVNSLKEALDLAASDGRGCRFVTLQGELLEADGRVYAGTFQGETTVVSRRSELRRLKTDLQRLDNRIEEAEQEFIQKQAELEACTAELRALEAEQETHAETLAETKSAMLSQQMECERLERSVSDARESVVEKTKELETCRAERVAAAEALAQVESQLADEQKLIQNGERKVEQMEQELTARREQLSSEKLEMAKQEERLENLQSARSRLGEEQFQRDAHREEAVRRLQIVREKRDNLTLGLLNSTAALSEHALIQESLSVDLAQREREREEVRAIRSQLSAEELKYRHALRELEERAHEQEMNRRDLRHQISNVEERLQEEFGVSVAEVAEQGVSAIQLYVDEARHEQAPDTAAASEAEAGHDVDSEETVPETDSADEPEQHLDEPEQHPDQAQQHLDADQEQTEETTNREPSESWEAQPPEVIAEIRKAIESRISTLRRKLKSIGNVSVDSLQELEDLESRYGKLSEQLQDLTDAKSSLEEIIRRINSESRRLFKETFEEIRGHFQGLFRKLFGGGDGDIILEDAEDILECGIDVVARPPGKELRSISLLSGGEKTLTAVAMLMALFQSRPSPFCILDEVDAALDDANIERYVGVIEEFQDTTQFIVITHAKRTMVGADVLYGVTMEESGVSKRMSVRFDDVSPDGHFKIRPHGDIDESETSSDAA